MNIMLHSHNVWQGMDFGFVERHDIEAKLLEDA
jgi:hypothetical protein